VWRLSNLQMNAVESLGYPTQKTEELLSKIIAASSHPGDLVADFFCGSGTTLAVAEKLGRRWIGCDQGRPAMHTARKRLLDIADGRPFDVLDLGDGERRYWYEISFATERRSNSVRASCAYGNFILNLYGARPVTGLTHLHGKKGRAMVRVCTVDATVSRAEIAAALDECAALNRPELHILGWEWEQSLDASRFAAARTKGVKVLFLQIPREVMDQHAVEKGEVRFISYLRERCCRGTARRAQRCSSTVHCEISPQEYNVTRRSPDSPRDAFRRDSSPALRRQGGTES